MHVLILFLLGAIVIVNAEVFFSMFALKYSSIVYNIRMHEYLPLYLQSFM